MQNSTPSLLSVREAMSRLNVGRTTFYKLLKDRELEVVKINAATRITDSSIAAFIARNTIAARKYAA